MSIYRAWLRNTSNALSPRVSSKQIRLQVPPKLYSRYFFLFITLKHIHIVFIIIINNKKRLTGNILTTHSGLELWSTFKCSTLRRSFASNSSVGVSATTFFEAERGRPLFSASSIILMLLASCLMYAPKCTSDNFVDGLCPFRLSCWCVPLLNQIFRKQCTVRQYTTPIYLINLLWKLGLGLRLDSELHYISIYMENKENEHFFFRECHGQ